MFADDTTLIARTRASLRIMLREVNAALAEHGLKLNADKCMVQSNTTSTGSILVGDVEIPIVSADVGFKILGTKFTLTGRTSVELKERIAAGWAKFYHLWPLLGHRGASLKKRFQLFEASVSKSVLWCCESWNPTLAEKRSLKAAQNHMLRRIGGPRRAPEEDWVDWIKRSTRKARDLSLQAGVKDWVFEHLLNKWDWAGRVRRMDESRWAKRTTSWRDSAWCERFARCRPSRPGRNRWFRWEDQLRQFTPNWTEQAQDEDSWILGRNAFCQHYLK